MPTPVAGVTVQAGVEFVTDWWRRWTRHARWVADAGALGALAIVAALASSRGKGEPAHAAPRVAKHDLVVAAARAIHPPTSVESASATVTPAPVTPPSAAPLPPPLLRVTGRRTLPL